MNIIIRKPEPTDREQAERRRAYWEGQIRKKMSKEEQRERIAANVAKQPRGKSALGKCVAVVHTDDGSMLNYKYKDGEFGSDEWVKGYQKRYPHLCPDKL